MKGKTGAMFEYFRDPMFLPTFLEVITDLNWQIGEGNRAGNLTHTYPIPYRSVLKKGGRIRLKTIQTGPGLVFTVRGSLPSYTVRYPPEHGSQTPTGRPREKHQQHEAIRIIL